MNFLKERQKEIVLGLILCATAFFLWRNLSDDGTGGVAGAGRGAGAGGRLDLAALKLYPVDWASLTAPRPGYDPSGRNIFQFGYVPPPTPPPMSDAEKAALAEMQRKADEERKRQQEAAEANAREVARQIQEAAAAQANLPPPQPPKPQPPPIPYKFIGYFGPPEQKIAILHDGTDMIMVRQGDKVGNDFKVLEIGYESIKFGYTSPQFKGETSTLPMSSSY